MEDRNDRSHIRRRRTLLAVGLATVDAQHGPDVPRRPVHTFSIVARDAATGELGVVVQSHWFSVRPILPWIEAGVGAVATQWFIDPSYGELGLDLRRAGKSAPDALKAPVAGDAASEMRQVTTLDAQGRVAAHTGAKDIQATRKAWMHAGDLAVERKDNAGARPRIFSRGGVRARQPGDGLLARDGAREHGTRRPVAAALQPCIQGGEELGYADAAARGGGSAADGSEGDRSDSVGGEVTRAVWPQ